MKDISQCELAESVQDMLCECEIIRYKLSSVLNTSQPILQRALIQEGGYHALNLHNRFFQLKHELLSKRIGT